VQQKWLVAHLPLGTEDVTKLYCCSPCSVTSLLEHTLLEDRPSRLLARHHQAENCPGDEIDMSFYRSKFAAASWRMMENIQQAIAQEERSDLPNYLLLGNHLTNILSAF